MDRKELLKKYWFVLLVAIVLIGFVALYSYDAYKNRDVVIKNRQIDGKYVAYTIDDEPVYADDLYDSLYQANGLDAAVNAYQRAVLEAGYETTEEMKQLASNSAASILSYYSQDYIENAMKQMGYTKGMDDLVNYYINSQKQEIMIKDFVLAHKDEYVGDAIGTNGRLIYHILVKCDVTPVYAEDGKTILSYEANPTDEQKQLLATIQEELAKEDANFEYIAYSNSEDTVSAQKGGYIGIVNEENAQMYDPFFAQAALALKDGEVSEPIVSQYGYHIIKNAGSTIEDVVNDYYYINEIASSNPTLAIKAVVAKAEELGFEITDADLKAQIDKQLESAGE